jgi:hypothetical protein
MKESEADAPAIAAGGHPSASLRAGFLEKREKWRTPSYLVSTLEGQHRVILSALMWPTRRDSLVRRISPSESAFFDSRGSHVWKSHKANTLWARTGEHGVEQHPARRGVAFER